MSLKKLEESDNPQIRGQRSIDVEKNAHFELACNMTPLIRALTLGAKI